MNDRDAERQEALKKKHARTKRALKILGTVMVAAGLGLVVMGIVDMAASISNGEMPALFWGLMVGLPMLGFGGMFCMMGFRKELIRYSKDETVPIINEAGQEIVPAIGAVSGAVKHAEGDLCPHCGKANDDGAKFCRHCGAKLLTECPHCGESVKDGAFCDKCGNPLHK